MVLKNDVLEKIKKKIEDTLIFFARPEGASNVSGDGTSNGTLLPFPTSPGLFSFMRHIKTYKDILRQNQVEYCFIY